MGKVVKLPTVQERLLRNAVQADAIWLAWADGWLQADQANYGLARLMAERLALLSADRRTDELIGRNGDDDASQ